MTTSFLSEDVSFVLKGIGGLMTNLRLCSVNLLAVACFIFLQKIHHSNIYSWGSKKCILRRKWKFWKYKIIETDENTHFWITYVIYVCWQETEWKQGGRGSPTAPHLKKKNIRHAWKCLLYSHYLFRSSATHKFILPRIFGNFVAPLLSYLVF